MIDGKYPPIEQRLPHRTPMILIDRLVQTHGDKTVCEVVVFQMWTYEFLCY